MKLIQLCDNLFFKILKCLVELGCECCKIGWMLFDGVYLIEVYEVVYGLVEMLVVVELVLVGGEIVVYVVGCDGVLLVDVLMCDFGLVDILSGLFVVVVMLVMMVVVDCEKDVILFDGV